MVRKSWSDEIVEGQVVPCDIGRGEEASGRACGLADGYRLHGVGLVRMRDVYHPDEITDCCGPDDTCWGAIVIATPPRGEGVSP